MRSVLAVFALISLVASTVIERIRPRRAHGPTTVRMDFTRSGGFYAAPFPSEDLRRPDDGVDLRLFPGRGKSSLLDAALATISLDARGFSTTAGIFFTTTEAIDPASLPANAAASLTDEATAFLVDVDPGSPRLGQRIPVNASFLDDGGRYGATNLLTLIPYQGTPLREATLYAAVITTRVRDGDGHRLTVSAAMRSLLLTADAPGLSNRALTEFRTALSQLRRITRSEELAAVAIFRTDTPLKGMEAVAKQILTEHPSPNAPLTPGEVFADFCVYQSTIDLPQYQSGTPPYDSGGGTWVFDAAGTPVRQRYERANVVVTLPRRPMPPGGFPLVVFSRTGAGGERPLVDRGVRVDLKSVAGTGPAREFARAGFAGISIDGPLGGLRNPTHGDEQFLVFTFTNPSAIRDNLRQSAAELILTAHLIDDLTVDARSCPGLDEAAARFDAGKVALFGHSMGATIAPLALAYEPRFAAAILSGAGGSWMENLIHKTKPLPVRHVTEFMLGYKERLFTVTEGDPGLSILQWGAEAADPPLYGARINAQVLMFQGIVDHYILPPMANATSLSLGLDLAGEELDRVTPELKPFVPFRDVMAFSGRGVLPYPVEANVRRDDGRAVTAAVVQRLGDGVEDGHETVFQTAGAKYQYRCFLKTFARGRARIVAPQDSLAACE